MLGLDALTPGDRHRLRADLGIALSAGAVAALLMGAVVVTVGNVTDSEARVLFESALPTIRTFASTIMLACASTLALMLTILGLTTDTDAPIRGSHYERIRQIALADAVGFTLSTLLLVVLVVPLGEAAGIPHAWYSGIFYATALLAAALGGLAIGVMLLIYAAVRDLTQTFGPGDANPLLDDEDAGRESAEARQTASTEGGG